MKYANKIKIIFIKKHKIMKRSKPCLPRKIKKVVPMLRVDPKSGKMMRPRYYPRTKWVVRAERQFRRLWRTWKYLDDLLNEIRVLDKAMRKTEKELQALIDEKRNTNNVITTVY